VERDTPRVANATPDAAALPGRASPWVLWVAWGLIALGAALRVRQYAANRSLWLDEAMLALNFVHRSLPGLLRPLESDQAAPLGFLVVEKLLESIANRDYVLRLFPLVAGCVSLYLLYRLARQCVAAPFFLAAVHLRPQTITNGVAHRNQATNP